MKSPFFVLFCVLCSTGILHAQGRHHALQFSVGWNKNHLKDVNFSPLNYAQNGGIYALGYTRIGEEEKSIFDAHVNFLANDLTTSGYDHFTSSLLVGNFQVSYLRQVKTLGSMLLYLGGGYQFNINYLDFNDQDAFSFLIVHGLHLKSSIVRPLGDKAKLTASIAIPIVNLLVRPPYNGIDEELDRNADRPLKLITNGDFVSINTYQSLDFSLAYQFQLSKRLSGVAIYAFGYQNASTGDRFTQFQNQIRAGLSYQF